MLILYNTSHTKLEGLTNYKEFKIEREINIEDTLSFLYPISDSKQDLIQEECYIRTKNNEYIVKEVNTQDDDWTEYICKINIEGIKGKDVSHFETVEQNCTNSVNLALVGTGWTIGSCSVTKLRTIRKNNCNAYDVLIEIQTAYSCEMDFDSINKKVYIYESIGSDKGTYFAEQLNLKKLDIQRNSYDYITRLILLGKDGLDVTSVNGGRNYIENYQYSAKVISAYWEDNRYTVAQDLLEDGIARLNYLSKPYKSYRADILDLSNNSSYSILDYGLGDTITLLAKSKDTKEKQRIIKLTEYPEEPERNTVEIANKLVRLEDLQVRFQETSDTLDTVTTSDGSLDGSKVDSIEWSQLQNVHIVIADIQDLSVVTARIGTLEANSATITQLNATNASIVTLTANTATITNLNASNARIVTLEVATATINILLAGNIGAANLAAGAIQAGSAVIGIGAIASAQILSLDVTKLIAGNISTNKFTVQSDNGNLKILGDTIKLWDASGKERISLGLNSGDYNLLVRGADGTTVLFGTTGVTKEGITTGAVDDSKIDVNANINGSKLDISSVVSSINGGTTTLSSSKIALNGSTLDIQFGTLSSTVTSHGTSITNQSTDITALNTAIVLKASQTSLDTTNNNVGGINTRLSNAESSIITQAEQIVLKASQISLDTINNNLGGVTSRLAIAEGTILTQAGQIVLKVSQTEIDTTFNTNKLIFTNLVGCTATGNVITSTGVAGWGNSGFSSTYKFKNGDCIECCILTNNRVMLGLSKVDNGQNYTTIEFGFYQDSGGAYIYESAISVAGPFPLVQSDIVGIGIDNNKVYYYINGKVVYTSAKTPVLPLVLDSSIYNPGTIIGNIKIGTLSSSISSRVAITESNIALKVNANGVIAAINISPESIKLSASKIDLTGYATFASLSSAGATTINGSNITTGTINASRINLDGYIAGSGLRILSNGIIYIPTAAYVDFSGGAGTTYIGRNSASYIDIYNQNGDIRLYPLGHIVQVLGDITVTGSMSAATIRHGGNNSIWSVNATRIEEVAASNYLMIYANGTSYGAATWASDISFKENIIDTKITALDKIMSIKHREFDWKKHHGGGHCDIGYVSQELRIIDENMAFEVPQPKDENGNEQESLYQPKVDILIPMISKALQELKKEKDAEILLLRKEIEYLKIAIAC